MDPARELRVERDIDAPPDRVWDALANRQAEWFCPKPWRAEIERQDRRPGGESRMTFYGPNGEAMPQKGVYLAFDEGRRFVMTDALVYGDSGEIEPAEPFMVGYWEIEPSGSGTRFIGRALHWTDEAVTRHREMGFEAGWGAAADQLKAICEGS